MNTTITTNQHHRTAAVAIAVFVVTAVGFVPSSEARESGFGAVTVSSTISPYAEPNPAIGGRTMAQYVAEHVEQRIHVH